MWLVEVLQYLVRGWHCACAFIFLSNKVKTGLANPWNNKLIWSGLTLILHVHAYYYITPSLPHLLLKVYAPFISCILTEPVSTLEQVQHEETIEAVLEAKPLHHAIHDTTISWTVPDLAAIVVHCSLEALPTTVFLDGCIAQSKVVSSVVKCRKSLSVKKRINGT